MPHRFKGELHKADASKSGEDFSAAKRTQNTQKRELHGAIDLGLGENRHRAPPLILDSEMETTKLPKFH
jgi:hypothetical protein